MSNFENQFSSKKGKIEKEFEGWKTRDFSNWLEKGIKDYEKGNPDAFSPFHHTIEKEGETVIDSLARIYNNLPPNFQKEFLNGLALALKEQKNSKLMYLAGKLGALEIIPVVEQWLKDGSLANDEEFLALTLDVLCSASFNNVAVADILRRIEKELGPQIKNHAPMIFIALCRLEPDKWLDHLSLLGKEVREAKGPKELTARSFAKYVPWDEVKRNLSKIREEDKWLLAGYSKD